MASPTTARRPKSPTSSPPRVVRFLETGAADPGLFAPDVFCDFTLPTWRIQGAGRAATLALRTENHPCAEPRDPHRFDPTPTGFVLEVEEEWVDDAGTPWYCREMLACRRRPRGHRRARRVLHRRLGPRPGRRARRRPWQLIRP